MPDISVRTAADIGALIRDRRRALKLDQADLAQRIGVSRLWISQVEHGKPGASLALILRAFDALGVTIIGRTTENPNVPAGQDFAPIIVPDINAIVADARRKDRR